MSVLLVGYGDRPELELLADAVAAHGATYEYVDVTQWPGETPATIRPGDDRVTVGIDVDVDDVVGAYVVCHELFRPFEPRHRDQLDDDAGAGLNQLREHRGLFESLVRLLERHGTTVVPPLSRQRWQDRKPQQLDLFTRADLPVPETTFTNDPEAVRAFADRHDRVVYKPVTRGGAPHELESSDLTDERLARLATAPVQFQAFVPGDDLRVYVVDGAVVGAFRYESERFSFKRDQRAGDQVDVAAVSLHDDERDTARRAVDLADLQFGAVDLRRRRDGEHALLEVNEAPRFAAADVHCELGVADALVDLLA
jgi:glutathione synthase/RimK-type ligase-like ATP-grasp enzyme